MWCKLILDCVITVNNTFRLIIEFFEKILERFFNIIDLIFKINSKLN